MGTLETQLVYDVHNLQTQEYLRTFSTMDQVMEYLKERHKVKGKTEQYEIKTVVRMYWVEDKQSL